MTLTIETKTDVLHAAAEKHLGLKILSRESEVVALFEAAKQGSEAKITSSFDATGAVTIYIEGDNPADLLECVKRFQTLLFGN